MVVSPSVSRVLPVSILGVSHIPELVTAYLLPRTIDAAVYMYLHTVVQVYGDVLPWTVGAMDGAAAKGCLNICRTLQTTRTEGCSTAAFTGASLNGDVEILQWLIDHYPDLYDPDQCLTVAVDAGQADVVGFLNQRMGDYDKTPYLEIAAAKGDARVLEELRPWLNNPYDLDGPLHQALDNGHEEVFDLLLETLDRDETSRFNFSALNTAAYWGQAGLVELLLRKGIVGSARMPTYYTATESHLDVINVFLAECERSQRDISPVLVTAAEKDHCAVVECLLRHVADQGEDAITVETRNRSIAEAFSAAAKRRSIEMVKTLLGRCPSEFLCKSCKKLGLLKSLRLRNCCWLSVREDIWRIVSTETTLQQ
ncbi:hypothetical protein V7S43_007201 [Phytophthora oleae]|uniref:Uncharacterized protein n=1 Tax=Phytophthora oleae TaxID=2107226 RepID=A0ABD3FML4_9STRA